MKKSSKCDFKKLALLGIAGGSVLASQAVATDLNNYSQLLAFNGCGGSNAGCGGKGVGSGNSGSAYQAYRSVPASNYYYTDGSQVQAHCSGSNHCSSSQWQSSQPTNHCNSPSHCNGQSGQYYQSQPSYPSAGCHSATPQYYQQQQQSYYQQPAQSYYQQSAQPSQGCAAYSAPSYSASQPSHGCGGASQPNWQQTNPQPTAQPAQSATPDASAWNKKAYTSWEPAKLTADATKPATQRTLTENELVSQLNDQAKTTYQSLDAAGKALALKLANQPCGGLNECKGFNSCKTEEHACAGKGSCAGTATSNFKDKNLAVKVAALKMAEKRVKATSSKS